MSDIAFDRSFDVSPGEMHRVSPLVRRVLCANQGPFTFRGTSTFIVGTGEVAIIDPGPDDDAHLTALLAAVRGERVTDILVTHTHMDHSPLAAKLKAATGAVIRAFGQPAPAAASLGPRLDASIDREFICDAPMADGERASGPGWTLEAIHTPGHMSNHLCFALIEEAALFCGDHVMAWSTSVIAPPEGHMGQYFASLRRLLERDDALYHPAHGPSRIDPKPLVRAYLAHRRMREEAILGRVRAGDRTPAEIVRILYADVDRPLHAAAALSTLAHLEHLAEQGKVSSAGGHFLPA